MQRFLKDLTCEALKNDFLTYTKNEKDDDGELCQVTYYVYQELQLSDIDLKEFLRRLKIDIHAPSFENQYQSVIENIKTKLNVSSSEAELYHYNSALKVIKDFSMKQGRNDRYITKSSFLKLISVRDEVFDAWFLKRKGREEYLKAIKKECLSSRLNMEPFNRFFLIDCNSNEDFSLVKEIVLLIAKKWAKISKRQNPSFCPSIYLNGLNKESVLELKNSIYSEGAVFIDAYPFKGARLSSQHFYTVPKVDNKIKFKFVDSIFDLELLIDRSPATVEIYQFYLEDPYYNDEKNKHVKIKIEDINYIRDLNK